MTIAQRDQVVDDGDLPIEVPIILGGRWWIKESLGNARAFLEGILDGDRRRLNRGEDGIVDRQLGEHILYRSYRVVVRMQLRLKCPPFLFEQTIDVPLNLLIFVVDRLTVCPIDKPKLLANLSVEILLVLA